MNYNKKLSGAKAVFVPITKKGANNLPFIEDLRDRYIKYIDFYACRYLPEIAAEGLQTSANMYLTLADKTGNQFYVKDMPLERFDYISTTGCRQYIGNKLSLQNSYITCADSAQIGKVAMLVFWYDLPEYSRANKSELTITDSLTIPITTAERYNTLPDEERMALKRFRRILLGMPTITPNFQTGLTSDQLANLYLTLRKGTYNVIENLPVNFLWQFNMLEKAEFANIVFDLQNSYIIIGGNNTIPDVKTEYVGKCVFLNLVYEKQ